MLSRAGSSHTYESMSARLRMLPQPVSWAVHEAASLLGRLGSCTLSYAPRKTPKRHLSWTFIQRNLIYVCWPSDHFSNRGEIAKLISSSRSDIPHRIKADVENAAFVCSGGPVQGPETFADEHINPFHCGPRKADHLMVNPLFSAARQTTIEAILWRGQFSPIATDIEWKDGRIYTYQTL
ncbi:unnamed protein product [Protopolystoma xenopodis]|uniref:Uncharacterized protein n=1 Tax=Protopolystoma xenopodis TaxID=117903 RepID=A0A3S5AZ70_9PLAT|nr:unnamed protein product [Protopolystoma xenopodis]